MQYRGPVYKYQYVVDEAGNKKARPDKYQQDKFEPSAAENMPELEVPELGFDPFCVENVSVQGRLLF